MKIPTVKISDGNNGFVIINESDFDTKIHTKFLSAKEVQALDAKREASELEMLPEPVNPSVKLTTKAEAENWNRDQLRDYAKPFGITGRSTDEFLSKLEEAGKFAQPVTD